MQKSSALQSLAAKIATRQYTLLASVVDTLGIEDRRVAGGIGQVTERSGAEAVFYASFFVIYSLIFSEINAIVRELDGRQGEVGAHAEGQYEKVDDEAGEGDAQTREYARHGSGEKK